MTARSGGTDSTAFFPANDVTKGKQVFVLIAHNLLKLKHTLLVKHIMATRWIAEGEIWRWLGWKTMKKRSRLRRRIREWLNKRKEWKEENSLPSIANRWMNRHQEQLEKPKEFYQNEKPTEEKWRVRCFDNEGSLYSYSSNGQFSWARKIPLKDI
jgi:hypothetical protein